MINFIVCDDDKEITNIIKNIITKVMFKNNLEYKIHIFNSYNESFYKIIKSDIENKIYILDIEVGSKSGLDIASDIRENDWYSIIVILSSHYELEYLAYKSKILILDFISKFDLYEKKMEDTINLCINKKLNNHKLILKINRRIEQIEFNSILYMTYDSSIRKVKICTKTKEYETNQTLKELFSQLKGNFVYTHRACIVNLNNVKTIDKEEKIITFVNNDKIDLLSRNYLKELNGILN